MARSVYFVNCLREIRQTVYGRDMRKPIADACEQTYGGATKDSREVKPLLTDTRNALNSVLVSTRLIPTGDSNCGIVGSSNMSAVSILGADYRITDETDVDFTQRVSGIDYKGIILDPNTVGSGGEYFKLIFNRLSDGGDS